MTPDDYQRVQVEEAVLVMSGAAQRSNGHYDPAPPPGSIGDLIDRYHAAERAHDKAKTTESDARVVLNEIQSRLWKVLSETPGVVAHGGKAYTCGGMGYAIKSQDIVSGLAFVPDPQS
jgi:hypothetical protein